MDNQRNSFTTSRSKWIRTDNPQIWKDQYGSLRNMSDSDPANYQNGDPGYQIAETTQLTSFLPKNAAGMAYNHPFRYHGSNPNHWNYSNEKMLLFLNEKIGNLCDKDEISNENYSPYLKKEKKYKGAHILFLNDGDNKYFREIQKLLCSETCLFDPIMYFKKCGNHITLNDIADIDNLLKIPGFEEELSLYDEFNQRPYPQIDLNLLLNKTFSDHPDLNINLGVTGQREVRKFLIVLISVFTSLEETIDRKIGSFTKSKWCSTTSTKLFFKSSHVDLQSGLAPPPLSEWGWGPHYSPVDNPCINLHPCASCVRDYQKNKRIEPHSHWMNFHYKKEECSGALTWAGKHSDYIDFQTVKTPEYIDGQMIYYCNIGGCPEACKCDDCTIKATKENNTQCKIHIPDHPENFDEENHIQYSRKYFTESEVQKKFLSVKLPKMEKGCDTCTNNVLDHRFNHRSYHNFCNACVHMKNMSERTFDNICKYCLKIFRDKYTLKHHIGIHSEQFKCEDCHKMFACQGTLNRHFEEFHVKTEGTGVTCEICGSKYSNLRNLKDHQMRHKESLVEYRCTLCENETVFRYQRNLRQHYLHVHKIVPSAYLLNPEELLEKHTCQICSTEFDRKNNLKRHQRQQTCTPYSCCYCKHISKDQESFLVHMSKTHVKCNLCEFQTIYQFNLNKHVKKVHNKK